MWDLGPVLELMPTVIPSSNQTEKILHIVEELIRLTSNFSNELKSKQIFGRIQHLEKYLNQVIEELYLIR